MSTVINLFLSSKELHVIILENSVLTLGLLYLSIFLNISLVVHSRPISFSATQILRVLSIPFIEAINAINYNCQLLDNKALTLHDNLVDFHNNKLIYSDNNYDIRFQVIP